MEKNNYVTEEYERTMANLREKIRTFKKQGKDVTYSAIFITGKEKIKLVDRSPTKQLILVGRNLKYDHPDKVRIELFDGQESKNMLWVEEIITNPSAEEEEKPAGLHGLGEIEINQLVDERFKQRQQTSEYEAMKEKISGLCTENEELLDELEELRNQKEALEKELDTKKNIRYYAGMLGDILESFGIAKDTIRKPLAGLMGIEETDKQKLPKPDTDHSGIVENVSQEEERRSEIITLIGEYLRTTSNQALVKVFTIFSEVEKDEKVADTILEFLNTQKTTSHDSI